MGKTKANTKAKTVETKASLQPRGVDVNRLLQKIGVLTVNNDLLMEENKILWERLNKKEELEGPTTK